MTKSRFILEDKDIIIKEKNGVTPFRQVMSIIRNGGKANGGGNPYHDAEGKFTTGPSTAFGKYAYSVSQDKSWDTDQGDLGFDYEEAQDDKGKKILVETYMTPEHTDALLDTGFTMLNVSLDGDSKYLDSSHASFVADEIKSVAKELYNYGKVMQMASQWGGASKSTADRITEPPKRELEQRIKLIDSMMSSLGKDKTLTDKERGEVDGLYRATRAGYNTMKYLEDNLDLDGPRYTVDITDKLQRVK